MEIYREFRPKLWKDIIGQDEAVNLIRKRVEDKSLSHTVLIAGPSGTGKTTIAYVIAKKTGCGNDLNLIEINAADSRGIDDIRRVGEMMRGRVIGGMRTWIFDECQALTGDAQSALLKITEKCPPWARLIFCTTDPQKMKSTLLGRCEQYHLKPLEQSSLTKIIQTHLNRAFNGEGEGKVTEEERLKLAEAAEGSARVALQNLDKILSADPGNGRIDLIGQNEVKKQAIDLCRKLVDPKSKWKDITPILKDLKDQDVERVRRAVHGYAASCLLSGEWRANHLALVLDLFERNLFDTGWSGLVSRSFEIFRERERA